MSRQARPTIVFLLALTAFAGLTACSRSDTPPSPEPPPARRAPRAAPPVRLVAAEEPAAPFLVADQQLVHEDWREAAKRITLLDPDQFPEAPPELRQALKKLGCRIPQTFYTYTGYSEPPWDVQDNLFSGYFKSTSELHWAVLCTSSGEETSLLVFDSMGQNMETLAGPEKNTNLMMGTIGNDAPDFSWTIHAAGGDAIIEDFESIDGDESGPPAIFQETLSSSYDEKSATIYYWHQCRWMEVVTGC